MSIIEVSNITKVYKINKKKEGVRGAIANLFHPRYESKIAVDNISFNIDAGEMVGYIGSNGAGKSTTIKMLTGILAPTKGEVKIHGINPQKNRIKNNLQIGTIFGQRTQLWWDIPVIESYKLIQKIYEVPAQRFKKNMEKFTEILDLKELLNIPVRQLSLGQKMRCEIAAAFLYDPKIVYLDEPTIGLDVVVKDRIRDFIKSLNKEKNTTIILTTHDMQDVEEICNRIIIIENGSILYDGGIAEIKSKFGKYRVMKLKVKNVNPELDDALAEQKENILLASKDTHEIVVEFDGQKLTASSVMELISRHCEVLDLTIQEPSIESIAKDLYGR